jgi:hypothetical protein
MTDLVVYRICREPRIQPTVDQLRQLWLSS